MKRKIYSLLTLIFIVFACFASTACGDKYKDMEFKVLYAFSEDSKDWFDGTNGISLNYKSSLPEGDDVEESLVFNEDGVATIYIKVQIENVKTKHVDTISVSATSLSGLNFSSKRVKPNKAFDLQITGNVNTTLKFYENNSGKNHNVDFSVYKTLEKIEVDNTIKPAMQLNGYLSLLALDNLKYYPLYETNQTGVTYEISGIGYYDNAYKYVNTVSAEDANEKLLLKNGVLRVVDGEFFNEHAHIVRIRATSLFHDGSEDEEDIISAEFDVYLIEANIASPIVKFENIDGEPVQDMVNIYENGGENYSTSTIFVNLSDFESIYATNKNTIDGQLNAVVAIYVHNGRNYERYVFDSEKYQSGINGLMVSKEEDGRFKFSISNRYVSSNLVKVAYEVEGLNFSASQKLDASKMFEVKKGVLPTCITVNDTLDLAGGEQNAIVYGTKNPNYKGLALKLVANPSDNEVKRLTLGYEGANLIVTDGKNPIVSNQILSGSTIYVKFKDSAIDSQTFTIKTLKVPTYYNGKDISDEVALDDNNYIVVKYNLSKLVTANSMQFVNSAEEGAEPVKSMVVDAENGGYVYVKVNYSGVELSRETVKLTSANPAVLFNNGLQEITLNDTSVSFVRGGTDGDEKYDIYAIPVRATNKLATTNISVIAGSDEFDITEDALLSTVYLMSESALENIKVNVEGSKVRKFTAAEIDNGAQNFAMSKGEFAKFNVVDGNLNSNTIAGINLVAKDIADEELINVFSKNALAWRDVTKSSFTLVANNGGKTAVIDLTVSYYALNEDNLIELKETTICMQVAIYEAVGDIGSTLTRDKIGYANPYFEETAYTEINFNSYTSVYGTPASSVKFLKDAEIEEISHASQIEISLNNFSTIKNSEAFEIQFVSGSNTINLLQDNNTILINGERDFLDGKIEVRIKDNIESISAITLTIRALRFGQSSNVLTNVTIKVAQVETVERISVSSKTFVQTADDSYELDLSFQGVKDDGYDEKEFNATLQFATPNPSEHAIRFDNISTALTHVLYQYYTDETTGQIVYTTNEDGETVPMLYRVSNDFLRITYGEDGVVKVRAYKNYGGGIFKLVLVAKDSYKLTTNPNLITLKDTDFETRYELTIRVSDGTIGAEYLIRTQEDLKAINNDLDAHYKLAGNIELDEFEPIGVDASHIEPFNGSLTGDLQTQIGENKFKTAVYTITYTVEKTVFSTINGSLAGLFGIIGETGVVANINLNVTFANKFTNKDVNGLKIGAVAGVNNGTIKDIYVKVNASSISLSGETTDDNYVEGRFSFGAVVGLNENIIQNCRVESFGLLTITSSAKIAHDIGFVAGINEIKEIGETNIASISGAYVGKASLNDYIFDVALNLIVVNQSQANTTKYNVGAVAGVNSGTVSNMLIGGQIVLESTLETIGDSYLGGLVGQSNDGAISVSTAMSLNITSNSTKVNVGGIVGNADSTTIYNIKFVTAETRFTTLGIASAQGKVYGNALVAGIVAVANNSTISLSSVESFIDTVEDEVHNTTYDFVTISGGTKTAGLVASISGTIVDNSFVSANLNGTNVVLTTEADNESKTYFIGKTNTSTFVDKTNGYSYVNGKLNGVNIVVTDYVTIAMINADNEDWTNIYIDNLNGTYTKADSYIEEQKDNYVKFNVEKWNTDVGIAGFIIEANYNVVNINGIDFYLPFLVVNLDIDNDGEIETYNEKLMIIEPQSISSALNNAYITDNNSIHVKEFNYASYNVVESVLVNYYNGAGDEANAHNLINTDAESPNGLIDVTLLPEDAQGGYAFEIIGTGYKFAYINGKKQIVFTAISAQTPVLVRIYSVFNPNVEVYVALYSQAGVSKLTLNSSSIYASEEEGYDYELSAYTGQNNKVISVGAENKHEGIKYQTIFDNYTAKQYLFVEHVSSEVTSKLDVDTSVYNNIALRIKEGETIPVDYSELITFTLYLKPEYFGAYSSDKVEVAKVKLLVRLYNAATDVEIIGSDKEITTHDDISLKTYLTTDYIDETEFLGKNYIVEHANVNVKGDIVLTSAVDADSIIISFDVVDGIAEKDNLIENYNKKQGEHEKILHFSELFVNDIQILKSLYKSTDKVIGYVYDINLELENSKVARYINSNITFNLIITAASNPDCVDSIQVILKPTVLSTVRIENYSVKTLNVNTDYTDIITHGEIEKSIIQPGDLGNVMMIYLEPTYSNVVSAKIKTSSLYVPSLGKNVKMKFTQLVYDERREGKFTTLYGGVINPQIDDTLELQLVSTINSNGEREYTGIICVYIQLEKFIGLESTMTVELEVESVNGKVITRTRDLLTTYLPGTQLLYNPEREINYNETKGYLIQKGTSNNEVKIKIQGYQFNKNPDITFAWELPAGSSLRYVNEGGVENKQKITDGTTTYLIGNYISYYLLNNYEDVEYNFVDNSYTITLRLNVAEDIPASFAISARLTLSTSDGQLYTSDDEENKMVFYPTEYILNSVYVDRLSNGRKNIAINKTGTINFKFTTDNENNDLSEQIYEDLVAYANRIDTANDVMGVKLPSLLSYYKNGTEITFDEDIDEFEVNLVNGEIISVLGLAKFVSPVKFFTKFGYKPTNGNNGLFEVNFGENSGDHSTQSIEFTFTLEIYANDRNKEIAIYSADEIYNSATGVWNLTEGAHYILMNDIVLENVVPITTAIGGLDGNNRVISIKSFAVNEENTNFGLFAKIGTFSYTDDETTETISEQTLLKNVIVDYSKFDGTLALNNNKNEEVVFGGLVAVNDGGLIYNCDVMNLNAAIDKEVTIIVSNTANVTFGGLVGNNSGVITNSRVGREGYSRITATKTTESTVYKYAGGLTFEIYNKENAIDDGVNQFKIVAGGFVGKNSGTISTSYITNTNLINYSTNETLNRTGGFVGENSGTISYSYAKADDDTLNINNIQAKGYKIENKGNGIVSGFVYENAGTIKNSYSNIELETKSAYISGFVYENNGYISECYSASIMNAGNNDNNAEQPFVGVDNAGTLLSNNTLENTYYLMRSETDSPYYQGNKDVAQGLNRNNFLNSEYLIGFAFVLSNSKAEREQGIWSYYTLENEKRVLPELMNANIVSHSYRFVIDESAEEIKYTNATSYEEGTVNNPHIISSVQEFNSVFMENNTPNQTGYIRFINNINFNNDQTAIKTRTNYVLGGETSSTRTSVEGNGMSVSGIYLDVGEAEVEKIGLFAEIKNTYIKNLNLNFAVPTTNGQFSTTTVSYSGGLAGKIEDSVILNIQLNGGSTTLTGANFVGGVAGHISGKSLVYGVETNVNVKADSASSFLYYNEKDYKALNKELTTYLKYENYVKTLSYAGAVAGVLDLQQRSNIEHNIQFIDVRGDQMASKINEGKKEANILAEYAGGIAGYANEYTNSFKLRYFVGTTDVISGNTAVGGLYGVALGDITASQVTAEEDIQFNYDTTIGDYIIKLQSDSSATLDVENAGNLGLLESFGYAGGLVGISLNSDIKASYSKAAIASGAEIGGLLGVAVGGTITYSYAIPYINLNSDMKNVGGLVGSVYGLRSTSPTRNDAVSEFETLLIYKKALKEKTEINLDIQFTYSTIVVDNSKISNFAVSETKLDYVTANYKDSAEVYLKSNSNTNLTYVYAGPVKYTQTKEGVDIVGNETSNTSKSAKVDLYKLYNVSDPSQTVFFQEVFSGWSVIKYWSLKEEKYFPLLNNKSVDNFIPIDSQEDLALIAANPKGKFKVVKSFPIDEKDANWIISGKFEGVLIGEIEGDSRRPIITVNGLNPTTPNASSGFFESAHNATISNLEIKWAERSGRAAIDVNKYVNNLTYVSGLVCSDEGSLISNVEVRVQPQEDGDGYMISSEPTATSPKTIQGFGGIVGYSINTNILGCTFAGKVKANLSAFAAREEIAVGGIVGYAQTLEQPQNDMLVPNPEEEKTGSNSSVINNSYVGASRNEVENSLDPNAKYPTTAFNLTVLESNNVDVYIGALVGHTRNSAIASNSVGGSSNMADYKDIDLNINLLKTEKNIFVSGMIGRGENGLVANCETRTNINVYGELKNKATLKVGGLAGDYSLATTSSLTSGISGCGVYSNISTIKEAGEDSKILSLGENNQLMVSTGLANMSGTATLKQCFFKGEILTEGASIPNIYAGGAVAYANSNLEANGTYVDLEEVITDVSMIVGTDATTNLFAGGLIGKTNSAQVSYSASWGRIVPITNEIATNIYAGGLVGRVAGNPVEANAEELTPAKISINNSYTISSIIADSISAEVIKNLNIGALIGSIPENSTATTISTRDVYYTSDYALFADENYVDGDQFLGINLSAQAMLYGNVWHSALMTENGIPNTIWTNVKSTSANAGKLPYIVALESYMKDFGAMTKPVGSSEYDFALGSAMRPIQINTTGEYTFEEEYTYYILLDNSRDIDNPAKTPTFKGALNGFLIGQDLSFDATFNLNGMGVYGAKGAEEINSTYYGVVPAVLKHSAVSNLHVKIINRELDFEDYTGIIAGANNGVIFNSSVQGYGITISSGQYLGLIASKNSGLISYCYSSAEIINVNGELGGIVHTNEDKLLSNYFTGYIRSEADINLAGIVVKFSGLNNYAYNNYMAGVVVGSKNHGANNFSASEFGVDEDGGNIGYGSNNYIDKYSDVALEQPVEYTKDDDTKVTALTPISTGQLMSEYYNGEKTLYGEWHYAVEGKKFKQDEAGNITATTFGYNYNYPVYRFNKQIQSDTSGYKQEDFKNQLYTGKGLDGVMDTQETRYSNLMAGQPAVYNDAIKIPHLGVLTSVQGLTKQDRNYVVIYDLDGKDKDWTSVGLNQDINDFAYVDGFKGVFITNKNYAHNSQETLDDRACIISNLSKNGLFITENDANTYFGDIVFGDFKKLVESGPLGNVFGSQTEMVTTSAVKTSSSKLVTVVNNIQYTADTKITGANQNSSAKSNCYGGLFGITIGNVEIQKFTTSIDGVKADLKLQSNGGSQADAVVGLIAGKNNGIITLKAKQDSKYYAYFEGNNYAGGIVGEMLGGTIEGNDNEIRIVNNNDGDFVNILGGAVGKSSGDAIINNIKILLHSSKIEGDAPVEVFANAFGGVVAHVDGVTTITACVLDTSSDMVETISVLGGTKTGRYYGLIAGKITKDLIVNDFKLGENINEFKVLCNKEDALNFDDASTESGVGAFVGHQTANLTVNSHNIGADGKKITIVSVGVPNLGGISGYYNNNSNDNGKILIHKNHKPQSIVLNGTTNVGGLFGYCNANLNNEMFGQEKAGVESEYFNFIAKSDSSIAFAEIIVGGEIVSTGEETIEYKYNNFGGLIGKWIGNNIISNGEKTEYVPVCNYNTITVSGAKTEPKIDNGVLIEADAYDVFNVGGVVGKLQIAKQEGDAAVAELTNKGEFKTESSRIVTTSGIASMNPDSYTDLSKLNNVGGVIGYVASNNHITIKNLINENKVIGYQNVGGLIGYMSKVILTSDAIAPYLNDNISLDPNGFALKGGILTPGQNNKNLNKGSVYGVMNVGGAVGLADSNSVVNCIYSSSNVYGNTSVGGLVGFAFESKVRNNYLTNVEGGNVRAVFYYSYVLSLLEDGSSYIPLAYMFVPTSVGGLVGTSESAVVSHNILKGVALSSANESDGTAISLNNNCIAPLTIGKSNNSINFRSNSKIYDLNGSVESSRLEEITTGFGGLIGSYYYRDDGTNDVDSVENNYLLDIDINAQLGVNVGTFFGAYNYEGQKISEDGTSNVIFTTPHIYSSLGNICIDGGYNIGSAVGLIPSGSVGRNLNISNENFNGKATILLQSRQTGMYVGGLIGRANEPVSMMSLVTSKLREDGLTEDVNVKIKIYTDDSYYMGGLVGYINVDNGATIYGTMDDIQLTENENNDDTIYVDSTGDGKIIKDGYDYTNSVVVGNHANNFGGLIGFLKLGYNGSGINIEVSGSHYYPFTINTIENSNYFDGESLYNIDDKSNAGNVYLIAQATYVNLDHINVIGSKNASLYDGVDDHNPLNKDYFGWSKEYTGFKVLRRNIPATQNSGLWDSIGVLFDASKITHVGTIKNLNLSGKALRGKESLWERNVRAAIDAELTIVTSDGDISYDEYNGYNEDQTGDLISKATEIKKPAETDSKYQDKIQAYNSLEVWKKSGKEYVFSNNYICYTIYEEEPGSAKLYSAIGIALPAYDYESEDNAFVNLKDEKAKWYSWIGGVITGDAPEYTFYLNLSHKDNSAYNGATYFDWRRKDGDKWKWNTYTTVGGSDKTFQNAGASGNNEKKYLTIQVYNYHAGDIKPTTTEDEGVYFLFDVVYENASYKNAEDNLRFTDAYLPDSGSIFAVSGISSSVIRGAQNNNKAFNWFGLIVFFVTIIVDAVISYFTGGGWAVAKFAMKQGLKAGIKGVLKAAGKIAFAIFKHSLYKIAKLGLLKGIAIYGGYLALCIIIPNLQIGAAVSEMPYLQQLDRDFGYLGNAYTHEIKYKDGQVDYSVDDAYFDEFGTYVFYSFDRPSDYLENRYMGFKIDKSKILVDNIYGEDPYIKFDPSKLKIQSDSNSTENEFERCYFPKELVRICRDETEYNTTGAGNEELNGGRVLIGDDGTDYWYLTPYYAYGEGCYWVNMYAAKEGFYAAGSMLYEPTWYKNGETVVTRDDLPYVVNANNTIYEYGAFDYNTGYSISDHNGNNIKCVGKDENGYNKYEINSESLSHEIVEYIPEKPMQYLRVTENVEVAKQFVKENGILGYDYFDRVYYIPNGTDEGADHRYAIYKPCDDDGVKIDNVNYISGQYKVETTSEVYQPAQTGDEGTRYYRLDDGTYVTTKPENYIGLEYVKVTVTDISLASQVYELESINTKRNETVNEVGKDQGDSIQRKIYPGTFINPYNDDVENSYSDEFVYTYQPDGEGNIGMEIKLFYYEGGYIVENGNKDIFVLIPKVPMSDLEGTNDENGTENGKEIKTDTYSQSLYLYDGKGNLVKNGDRYYTYQDIVDNFNKLKDYYISNVGTSSDPASNNSDYDDYKVSNVYRIKGSGDEARLYILDNLYVIGNGDNGVKGLLHKKYVIYEHTSSLEFITNKYCSNSQVLLFTHYKYRSPDTDHNFLTGRWYKIVNEADDTKWYEKPTNDWTYEPKESKYYLIPKDMNPEFTGRPNSKITHLLERVQVVINGYNSQVSNSEIGRIRIK